MEFQKFTLTSEYTVDLKRKMIGKKTEVCEIPGWNKIVTGVIVTDGQAWHQEERIIRTTEKKCWVSGLQQVDGKTTMSALARSDGIRMGENAARNEWSLEHYWFEMLLEHKMKTCLVGRLVYSLRSGQKKLEDERWSYGRNRGWIKGKEVRIFYRTPEYTYRRKRI